MGHTARRDLAAKLVGTADIAAFSLDKLHDAIATHAAKLGVTPGDLLSTTRPRAVGGTEDVIADPLLLLGAQATVFGDMAAAVSAMARVWVDQGAALMGCEAAFTEPAASLLTVAGEVPEPSLVPAREAGVVSLRLLHNALSVVAGTGAIDVFFLQTWLNALHGLQDYAVAVAPALCQILASSAPTTPTPTPVGRLLSCPTAADLDAGLLAALEPIKAAELRYPRPSRFNFTDAFPDLSAEEMRRRVRVDPSVVPLLSAVIAAVIAKGESPFPVMRVLARLSGFVHTWGLVFEAKDRKSYEQKGDNGVIGKDATDEEELRIFGDDSDDEDNHDEDSEDKPRSGPRWYSLRAMQGHIAAMSEAIFRVLEGDTVIPANLPGLASLDNVATPAEDEAVFIAAARLAEPTSSNAPEESAAAPFAFPPQPPRPQLAGPEVAQVVEVLCALRARAVAIQEQYDADFGSDGSKYQIQAVVDLIDKVPLHRVHRA
ncbi:hypothetical protein J8273_1559 [Carpediemonas membranifera]|uniref:Uncharacterized protein n=1 Tax=Carpediemonas membranifera TaxID=201153 RepID=A0A8J6E477_9EUKA|nr:hypothetical protein J8273_1559 [Carpediemonas membranifera]|eukprot:KAG9396551.1 hypothetical protein J8273_1559 [Carpediemonas membranifera]